MPSVADDAGFGEVGWGVRALGQELRVKENPIG